MLKVIPLDTPLQYLHAFNFSNKEENKIMKCVWRDSVVLYDCIKAKNPMSSVRFGRVEVFQKRNTAKY